MNFPPKYARRSTPPLSYVGETEGWDCYRLQGEGRDALDCLYLRGDITGFLMKEGIEHQAGTSIRGLKLPDNPKRRDWFVAIRREGVRVFHEAFEVRGYNPLLAI
jgi:hypothetical protein